MEGMKTKISVVNTVAGENTSEIFNELVEAAQVTNIKANEEMVTINNQSSGAPGLC